MCLYSLPLVLHLLLCFPYCFGNSGAVHVQYLQIGDKCTVVNVGGEASASPSSRKDKSNFVIVDFNKSGGNESLISVPVIDIGIDNLELGKSSALTLANPSCDPNLPLDCVSGRCQCKQGYTINSNGTKCLEIARNGLDSGCDESIQCWKSLLGRLSECNGKSGKCSCYESESLPIVFHQGRCYYGESLGDYCQIDGLCMATTPNANCRSGSCQCKENFVPSWDKSKCLPIATQGLNSSCEENIQCEKSPLGTLSECNQESMTCSCYYVPGVQTVFYSGRCYFGAELGDVCQVSSQCEAINPNSVCGADGKCRCNEEKGFIPNRNNSICLSIPIFSNDAVPGGGSGVIDPGSDSQVPGNSAECQEDIQCIRALGHFSKCNLESKKCECTSPDENDSTPMVIIGAKCYSTKGLGDSCNYNAQCSTITNHSICNNGGVCTCNPESHIMSSDGKKCLEIGNNGLGSTCEEDSQCTESILGPLSKCDSKTRSCICSNLLPIVYYNKQCYFHRQLGSPCESTVECQAGGNDWAECSGNGKCQCKNGTEANNSLSKCELLVNDEESLLSYNEAMSLKDQNESWVKVMMLMSVFLWNGLI